jgi:hypothetical protein
MRREVPLGLTVDGKACDPPPDAGSSLGELIVALRDRAADDGRVITTISLNGDELIPDGEAEALARPAADFESVELTTAAAAEWGRHGLGEAASASGRLADEFQEIADALRGGRREESVDRFQGAVAAYGRLIQALVNAAALAGVPVPDGFQGLVQEVTGAMKEVPAALAADDAVAAADVIEYELADRLEKLRDVVKGMASQ